ncbi:MAG: hypothetical protein H6710_12210 [Myxococcales bacterium]|nr:hypothetical protein [Myxococcales bacterium]
MIAGAEAASYAAPLTPRVALWTLVLAVGGAIAGRLAGRTSPLALWAGAWIALALLDLIVAIVAPGAVVALLPAIAVQVVIAAIALALAGGRRLPSAAIYLGLLAPAYLWLQAALRVEDIFGLGRHGGALALAPLALLAGLLAPIWAAAPARQRRLVLALAAVLVAGAGLVAALAPAHSPTRPRRLSYTLHRDADAGESRWLIAERAGGLPASVRAAAEFADAPAPSFPWSGDDDESYIAPAADLDLADDLAPPELTLLADEPGPWGRLLRLRLRSPRGARRAALLIPDEAGVRAIAIDGATLGPYPERRREDYPDARCHGVIGIPPEGVEIALILAAPGPTEFTLWDLADGLPDAPASEALKAARPPDHVASHGGDITMVSRRQSL